MQRRIFPWLLSICFSAKAPPVLVCCKTCLEHTGHPTGLLGHTALWVWGKDLSSILNAMKSREPTNCRSTVQESTESCLFCTLVSGNYVEMTQCWPLLKKENGFPKISVLLNWFPGESSGLHWFPEKYVRGTWAFILERPSWDNWSFGAKSKIQTLVPPIHERIALLDTEKLISPSTVLQSPELLVFSRTWAGSGVPNGTLSQPCHPRGLLVRTKSKPQKCRYLQNKL